MKLSCMKSNGRLRVIGFEISASRTQETVLNSLIYSACKLWNIANYERRCWTHDSGIAYPDWYDQKKRLKDNYWYKNLPSQTSQELLKQLHEAWQSYYTLVKTGGIENPKPPRYKNTKATIRFLNKGFSIIDGKIRITVSKKQKEYLAQKYGIQNDFLYIPIPDEYIGFHGNPKIIEIIALGEEKYKVNMIIELSKAEYKPDNGVYMAVDLGINNLLTCHISTGKSVIISGRQLLSINRYFDKEIGYYQSIAYAQQSAKGDKYPKKTKRIEQLYKKRSRQVEHLLHAATKKEVAEKHAQKNNRKYRGLYVTDKQTFNADCIGAYNILKKYLCRTGKAGPAVVGLDTPMMYRWNSSMGFVSNQKLAISMAM